MRGYVPAGNPSSLMTLLQLNEGVSPVGTVTLKFSNNMLGHGAAGLHVWPATRLALNEKKARALKTENIIMPIQIINCSVKRRLEGMG